MSRAVVLPLLLAVSSVALAQPSPASRASAPAPPAPYPAPQAVYPQTVYPTANSEPALATTAKQRETDRILEENPTLVRELLRAAVATESVDEEGFQLILYRLGPQAVEPLIAALDEPELRTAALLGLMSASFHEESPRSKIVKAILAAEGVADDDRLPILSQLLLCTNAEFRARCRRAVEAQMREAHDFD